MFGVSMIKDTKTTRFGFDCNLVNMKNCNKHNNLADKKIVNSTALFCIIAVGLILLVPVKSVKAQYVVQPATIVVEGNARKQYDGELKIHNFDPNNDIVINLKVIELTQKVNGEWLPFTMDPCSPFDYYPGMDLSKVSSCSSWIKLEKTSVSVPKDGDASLTYSINTPLKTKTGFYGATIMASMMTKASQTTNVPMYIRTGVPVIVKVNTAGASDKVEIQGVGMEFVPSRNTAPGKVLATMKVKNKGSSFPRVRAIVRIRSFMDKHWRVVTTHEFSDMGIIPGVELELKSDIGKSLPSGKYRLDGVLYVNGSMAGSGRRWGQEIDFEGDPLITRPATDVPIDLDPTELTIEARPGARRSTPLKIHNASDEDIKIEPVLDVPQAFKGLASGSVKLEDAMTCMKWLEFNQDSFQVKSFGNDTLIVTAKLPDDAVQFPNYYALLGLKAVYPDGQVAGTTWLNVCVKNPGAAGKTEIAGSSITLTELNSSKSEYIVQARFVNSGETHIFPSMARAAVVKADGFGRTSALLSCDKKGMFLPYESRYYTGVLDFSTLDADDYNLEALLDYPEEQSAQKQVRIRVVNAGKAKKPEIIEQNVKSTDLVQVKWK